jgi:hypothetical protein
MSTYVSLHANHSGTAGIAARAGTTRGALAKRQHEENLRAR